MGVPIPSRLGSLGERRKPLSGVRGRAMAENKFGTFPAFTTSLISLVHVLISYRV